MKKMLMFGLYGLLILGASAGGTWFLRSKDIAEIEAASKPTDPLTQSTAALASPVDVTRPLPDEVEDDLPVAVRPGEMSVEEIVRYGLGLKAREAVIRQREESLQRTEAQHRLLLADIDGEQQEIEGLVAQARDQRIASEQLLAQAQQERIKSEDVLKQLDEKKQKLDLDREKAARNPAPTGGVGETEVDREANIKEFSAIVSAVSPEVAAGMMRDFANDGKIDLVVEILAELEERNAAKIVDSMSGDSSDKLVSEIAKKYVLKKSPIKVANKRR
ncbi:MAG TPA: hypothetical protein EYG03_20870 [Planctomycetes bacterium]|nr:hypothetical protein [Fuerstiella sp.]HIK94404.1 hypothetical protein [Planctomycetota bacterium]